MKKIQEHKKLIIIVGAILLAVIVLLAVLLGGKENDNEKVSDKPKQEMQVDDEAPDADKDNGSDSEGGLVISGPEEADKEDSKNQVEFVGPDGVDNNIEDNSNQDNNTSDNEHTESGDNAESGGDTEGNENTDDSDKKDNLKEETDETGQYGGFF